MSQPTTWGAQRVADAPVTPTAYAIRADDSFDAILSSHSGAARPDYAVVGTVWHDTDNADLFHYDGANDLRLLIEDSSGDVSITNNLTLAAGDLIITTPTTPDNATATGVVGTIAWDSDYIYVCVATDTWERSALVSW